MNAISFVIFHRLPSGARLFILHRISGAFDDLIYKPVVPPPLSGANLIIQSITSASAVTRYGIST
jgi:hypothetical protein